MPDEKTSKRVASIAARGLTQPESLTHDEIQAVCASCLTQAAQIKAVNAAALLLVSTSDDDEKGD